MARRGDRVERRRHERIPLAIPVFIRGQDTEHKEFLEFATALNVSATGVLLATRRYLPSQAVVSLEIPSASLPPVRLRCKPVHRVQGRLVRTSITDGYHLWAVKFKTSISSSKVMRRKVHSRQVKTFSSAARV